MGFADYFDARAKRFSVWYRSERVTRLLGRGAIIDRLQVAVDAARESRAMRVLDVGCGSGPLFGPLARCGIEVVGIDPSPEMVTLARAEADRWHGLVTVYEMGWEAVPALAGEFDLAVGLGLFDYIDPCVPALQTIASKTESVLASFPAVGLRTAARTARYGRRDVSVTGYSVESVVEHYRDAGLDDVDITSLGRAGFVAHGRRTCSGA